MDDSVRMWCGPDKPPRGSGKPFRKTFELNSHPDGGNVNLIVGNISRRLAQNIPDIALDLLEVGSYVYCADQTVRRGGRTWPKDGQAWHRDFVFDIPVRRLDIWNKPEVTDCLEETLGFLSDDHYQFRFRPLTRKLPREPYFEFGEDQPWFKADQVLLFSGGLDSLAGAVSELVANGKRVLLVSHRPVAKTSKRQVQLVDELKRFVERTDSLIHVPVWVNKAPGLSNDANQRARSFLYVALAGAVAELNQSSSIRFYENGIVSTNLPISGQLVGSRASRSTHPKVLDGFSKLLSLVLGRDFVVDNPFYTKTKSDVVRVLLDHRAEKFIGLTNSCSHTRTSTKLHSHCGVCSQCIERRLATLYNDVGEDDPQEMYRHDLFLGSLTKDDDRKMVASYIDHARLLEEISGEDFCGKFPEALRILPLLPGTVAEAADLLFELHQRHGKQVGTVVKEQIKKHADLIYRTTLPRQSLLDMLVGGSRKAEAALQTGLKFPTPEGTEWRDIELEVMSHESVRVRTAGLTRRYTGFDMGFRDGRKRDLLNKQWDTLIKFAEGEGVLSWTTRGAEPEIQKSVQALNRDLRIFFGMDEMPIRRYQKKFGWTTKFKIRYLVGGR